MRNKGLTFIEVMAAIATLCALAMTILLVKREFFNSSSASAPSNQTMENWDELLSVGHQSSDRGKVELLMFSDFECPACRSFHQTALLPAIQEFGTDLRLIHRHYPLSYHRFAQPAAIAAECAALTSPFFEMHDALFRYQDSLGLKSFVQIAASAGVDTVGFQACLDRRHGIESIERDLALARSLKLNGTPSIAIDGVLLGSVPDSLELSNLIAQRLRGEPISVQ